MKTPPLYQGEASDKPRSVLKMSNSKWVKAWNDNAERVNGVRAMHKTFKTEATAAIAHTRVLIQRSNLTEPIEKINIAMEDVDFALESFSATLA